MNRVGSLAPALVSGSISDLWLYWSATFVWTIAAIAWRKKLIEKMKQEDKFRSIALKSQTY